MELNIGQELAVLRRLTPRELRERYTEVFGETTNAHNRAWLVKRIAWRLQALAEGDLSERARRRAAELAQDADLRLTPPRPPAAAAVLGQPAALAVTRSQADSRLPPPGTVLTRKYKGQVLQVQILPRGFAFEGRVYPSLSAVAKAITGSHCNGFAFFRLGGKGGEP